MKISAKFYYHKSKVPGDRIAIKGAKNVLSSLQGLAVLIQGTSLERATRLELTVTVPARRSS